jgi:alpha-D-ribose 1-methylphosphonate 5-triphosphate synthase subunit PhnH
MTVPTLIKGFQQPTQDSQVVFRQLLKAMSEPGTIVSVGSPETVAPLYASTFAVCQGLMDQQTPLWLSPHFLTADIKHNLHFHTGVPIVEQGDKSVFALTTPYELQRCDLLLASALGFSQGSSEYPETGCSVIIQVTQIAKTMAESGCLRLTGPGIERERFVLIDELPPALLDYLLDETGNRRATFPLGLDFIFVDPTQLMCLPRTTQVEVL